MPPVPAAMDDPVILSFVRGKDCSSRAIGWFSAGYFSHVDAVAADGRRLGSRSDVVMGVPAGVEWRPAKYEKFRYEVQLEVPMGKEERQAFWVNAQSQLHKPYDPVAILGFAFGRNWRDEGAWFCSELFAWDLEKIGVFRELILPPNKVPPGLLAELCSALGAQKTIVSLVS